MAIQAIALLRLPIEELVVSDDTRVDALEDGVLVHTRESFAREPTELSLALHELVGDGLTAHRDARGILFIPDVAGPKARSYEQVVTEVGEGGVWGPLVDQADAAEGGEFGALLGNLLGQMPSSLLAAANAAAQGEPGAFANVTAQLQGMLNNSSELSGLAAQFAGMLGQPSHTPATREKATQAGSESVQTGELAELAAMAEQLAKSGIDLSSPVLRELTAKMEGAFAHELSPAKGAKRRDEE